MLKRMLLLVLTICLALPAAMPAAAAHPAPASAMMMHHAHHDPTSQPKHDPADHAGKHQCIGCAVPVNLAGTDLAPPLHPAELVRPALVQRLGNTRDGPETPPPRF